MFVKEYDADAELNKVASRSVYIIMYWDGSHIRDRIQRICDTFSGQRFELPELHLIDQDIQSSANNIVDARNVLD